MRRPAFLLLCSLALIAVPAMARDSLGVFERWAAFRDPQVPRCYAIAAAQERASEGSASVGTWPARRVRGQVHFRLSRAIAPGSAVSVAIGRERFTLTASARNAWATDAAGDAAIIAAMRGASVMQVRARDRNGRVFTDSYPLAGVATAVDAADIGCRSAG